MNPYTKAAQRGATRLDSVYPGWDDKIDLDTLELESGDDDILGQLYKDKTDWPNPYEFGRYELGFSSADAGLYGFDAGDNTPEYGRLNEAWRKTITDRRALRRIDDACVTIRYTPSEPEMPVSSDFTEITMPSTSHAVIITLTNGDQIHVRDDGTVELHATKVVVSRLIPASQPTD